MVSRVSSQPSIYSGSGSRKPGELKEPSIYYGLGSRNPGKLKEPWDALQAALQPVPPGPAHKSGPSKDGPQHPIPSSSHPSIPSPFFIKVCSCPINPETRYLRQFFLQAVFLLRGIATSLLL